MNVADELVALKKLHTIVGVDFPGLSIVEQNELKSRLKDAIDCIQNLNVMYNSQLDNIQKIIDERNLAQQQAGIAQTTARAEHEKVKRLEMQMEELQVDKCTFRDALRYMIDEA